MRALRKECKRQRRVATLKAGSLSFPALLSQEIERVSPSAFQLFEPLRSCVLHHPEAAQAPSLQLPESSRTS